MWESIHLSNHVVRPAPVQIPYPTWAMVNYTTPRGLPEGDIEVSNWSAHNIVKKDLYGYKSTSSIIISC